MSLLARILGPHNFGIYNAFLNTSSSVNNISELGTGIVIQRAGARIQELGGDKLGAIFGGMLLLVLGTNLFLALLIIIFPDFFHQWLLNNEGSKSLFGSLSLIIVFQLLSQQPLRLIMGLGEFKIYAVRMIFCNAVILLIVPLSGFYFSIIGGIYGLLVALIINMFITWKIMLDFLKKYHITLSLNNFFKELQYIFREGFLYYVGNVLGGSLLGIVYISLFSNHIGMETYGFLRIAGTFTGFIGVIPSALLPVTLTLLAKHKKESGYLQSIQLRVIPYLSFFIVMLLLLFLNIVVELFFGAAYQNGLGLISWLLIIHIIILKSTMISNFLVAAGKAHFVGIMGIIGIIVSCALAFILIPIYKETGYMIAYSSGYIIGFIGVYIKDVYLSDYEDQNFLLKSGAILVVLLLFLIPICIDRNIYSLIWTITLVLLFPFLFYFQLLKKEEKNKLKLLSSGIL